MKKKFVYQVGNNKKVRKYMLQKSGIFSLFQFFRRY